MNEKWANVLVPLAVLAFLLSILPGSVVRSFRAGWGWQAEAPLWVFGIIIVSGFFVMCSPLMSLRGEYGIRIVTARLRGRNVTRLGLYLGMCALILGVLAVVLHSYSSSRGIRTFMTVLCSVTAASSFCAFLASARCRVELIRAMREERAANLVSCRTCGYSRTGLPQDHNCPECGVNASA